jgi:succinate dehydrogenase flavin-adding protein (antitoxin of CptAB toxin-antitoxin module)
MKELDLLLAGYLHGRWVGAAAEERAAFEAFLELPDPVIAGYLLGGDEPPDAGTQALVDALLKVSGPLGPATSSSS